MVDDQVWLHAEQHHQGPQGGQEGGDTQGSLIVIRHPSVLYSHICLTSALPFREASPASWHDHTLTVKVLNPITVGASPFYVLLVARRQGCPFTTVVAAKETVASESSPISPGSSKPGVLQTK